MPLPLIPIVSALAAGGTLVPHAAGGMIVTSAAGYVAGTYLSTAAIGGLLTAASTALGAGAIYLTGAAASIIGGAGIFGTTIGASGITGWLMSVGIIATTPIWFPVVIAGSALWLIYGSYKLYKLKHKINITRNEGEAIFTENEAKIVEKLIKGLAKKKSVNDADTESQKQEYIKKIKRQPWFK